MLKRSCLGAGACSFGFASSFFPNRPVVLGFVPNNPPGGWLKGFLPSVLGSVDPVAAVAAGYAGFPNKPTPGAVVDGLNKLDPPSSGFDPNSPPAAGLLSTSGLANIPEGFGISAGLSPAGGFPKILAPEVAAGFDPSGYLGANSPEVPPLVPNKVGFFSSGFGPAPNKLPVGLAPPAPPKIPPVLV